MVNVLVYIFLSVLLVSVVSLIGVTILGLSKKLFESILLILVAFAAGSMLGAAFFDLIPEGLENIGTNKVMPLILLGIIIFFIVERVIQWHHFHEECEVHPVSYLILVGDAVHNFGDGVIIAASYLIDFNLGLISTLAIIFHEIPQELGDFAILIKSGFSKAKALLYNFLSAVMAILGAVLTYFASNVIEGIIPYLISVAAGGFIYIAVADLLPGLHKETDKKKLILHLLFLIMGILFIFYFVRFFEA
ncbi:ZIP family metal transporter [Candidatus Woesearchaeota archaeon]|nr:ZIP family metal transporter [Candidatus Woesearchaeota archaeon]